MDLMDSADDRDYLRVYLDDLKRTHANDSGYLEYYKDLKRAWNIIDSDDSDFEATQSFGDAPNSQALNSSKENGSHVTGRGPHPISSSSSSSSSQPTKQIPYWKKIADTSFAVDAFNFDPSPEITYYFLSHFHYDHYIGLSSKFNGTIITSMITGKLVIDQIGIKPSQVIMVTNRSPIVVDGIQVILIDAQHCPGSVMFLFILPDERRILHTGDFRASPEMETDPFLIERPIDQIYLDTTYCHPAYNFPSQMDTIQITIDLTLKHLSDDPKLLIVCGTYNIGKEKVFKSLANGLSMNLWVNSTKLKVLKIINDPIINENLVDDKDQAQIHVLPLSDINHQFLKGYLKGCCNRFSSILAFKPCGWEDCGTAESIVPSVENNVYIYGIPYSEHSSYSELERFIKFFKPRMITSTVTHTNPDRRVSMFKSLAQWKSSYQNTSNSS